MLNLQRLRDHALAILGEQHDARVDATEVVNEAGRYLVSMHPWKFLERPRALLSFSAPISISNATWTESTKTLTKASAFGDYTFTKGDRIQITDGTGATAGYYNIASKTSDNAITLETSIGSDADGETDIDGTICFPYVALPADFDTLVKVESTNNYTRQVILTSLGHIETLRGDITEATLDYYVAIEYPAQPTTTDQQPGARLCLYPTALSASTDALSVVYRAGWVELSSNSQVSHVPAEYDALLSELVRAFARARADNSVTLSDALEPIERSTMLNRLKSNDGAVQPHIGPMRNGFVNERFWARGRAPRFHETISFS